MALRAPVTLRAGAGQSAMMTGARTRVNALNPAVNHRALPFGMTRMGLNPSDEGEEEGGGRWDEKRRDFGSVNFESTLTNNEAVSMLAI